jgi:hypothetical protein
MGTRMSKIVFYFDTLATQEQHVTHKGRLVWQELFSLGSSFAVFEKALQD